MSNINSNMRSPATPMPAELTELATLGRRSLSEAITLGQSTSSAFDVSHSINPLISAAAPLLMASTTLKKQASHPDPMSLYQTLLQEIKIFENKARQLAYRSAIILAARYFLCAFIDEILANTQDNIQQLWQQHPLLETLQNESWGGERFFVILERASDDSQTHVDLLEFGFLCLNLGYLGKYQKPEYPTRELENIKDNLLVLINKVRGYPPAYLFVKADKEIKSPCKKSVRKIPHLIIAAGLFVIGTLSVYIPYKIHLSHITQPLTQIFKAA